MLASLSISVTMIGGCSRSHSAEPIAAQPTDPTPAPTDPESVAAPGGTSNVLTYHNDNARTGLNARETILTARNVNSRDFGKIGFLSVQGLVDAEPLYVAQLTVARAKHNVVFVATEHDLV